MSSDPVRTRSLTCPACQRVATRLTLDLWCCLGCLAHGDALALAEYAVLGRPAHDTADWIEIACALDCGAARHVALENLIECEAAQARREAERAHWGHLLADLLPNDRAELAGLQLLQRPGHHRWVAATHRARRAS